MKTGTKPEVKFVREYKFDYRDEDANKLSTYYEVDPGQTIDNCNLDIDFVGKVVVQSVIDLKFRHVWLLPVVSILPDRFLI